MKRMQFMLTRVLQGLVAILLIATVNFMLVRAAPGDPALGVARNYTTANIAKGSPFNNVEGYSNPKVDALFEAGGKEADPEKRKAIYLEVQKILLDEVPVAWLYEINFPTLYRSKITNLVSSAIGLNDSLGMASIA